MFFIVEFFFVYAETSTYEYDFCIFLQQIAVSPFLICNIQYFPVITTVGLSQLSTTVTGTLSGESRQ